MASGSSYTATSVKSDTHRGGTPSASRRKPSSGKSKGMKVKRGKRH